MDLSTMSTKNSRSLYYLVTCLKALLVKSSLDVEEVDWRDIGVE